MFKKEYKDDAFDCISTSNPTIRIHEPKIRVDGLTKYVDTTDFKFDNVFGDTKQTGVIYQTMINPVLEMVYSKGLVTCFAYGQTGSGKTFTMQGVQHSCVHDLFELGRTKFAEDEAYFTVSFYEIYWNKLFDLLNNKKTLKIQEDYNNKFQITGLKQVHVETPEQMLEVMEQGNASWVT